MDYLTVALMLDSCDNSLLIVGSVRYRCADKRSFHEHNAKSISYALADCSGELLARRALVLVIDLRACAA